MPKYHVNPACYCDKCCETASEWWEWRSVDGTGVSGTRYWTQKDAETDREVAVANEMPILVHVAANGAEDAKD